jgi:hypothetical protein
MRCSGCGKDIPFGGQVCPYCQRDKSSDQAATVAIGIGLVIGGFLGNLVAGFTGMMVGGCVLGIVAGAISMSGKSHSAKKPPRVRVDPPVSVRASTTLKAAAVSALDGPEARLRRLDDLKAKGLLSDQEHRDQRKAVIAAL